MNLATVKQICGDDKLSPPKTTKQKCTNAHAPIVMEGVRLTNSGKYEVKHKGKYICTCADYRAACEAKIKAKGGKV